MTGHKLPDDGLLEDLTSRFVSNVPRGEVQSFENVMFLVEQAHWFYEDFYRERDAQLKSLSLREFALLFCRACPELQEYAENDGTFATHYGCVLARRDHSFAAPLGAERCISTRAHVVQGGCVCVGV